jgi:hypothetical protein
MYVDGDYRPAVGTVGRLMVLPSRVLARGSLKAPCGLSLCLTTV